MPAKIGINGFGRIGRLVFRAAMAKEGGEVAAINRLGTFRISYEGGQMIAAALAKRRATVGPFRTWPEFEAWIDSLPDEQFHGERPGHGAPPPNPAIVPEGGLLDRALRNRQGLRDLVMTLVFAFPGLMNVGALLGLVIFMFAVLGCNLFTYVQPGDDLNDDGRNFVTFANACLLLFQCLTGDGWSAIMDDAMINEDRGCDPAPLDIRMEPPQGASRGVTRELRSYRDLDAADDDGLFS